MPAMEKTYTYVLSPSIVYDIMRMATPRERWQIKYRAERLKRKGLVEAPIIAKVGTFHGVTFIA